MSSAHAHHWQIESPEEARGRGEDGWYIGRCAGCTATRRFPSISALDARYSDDPIAAWRSLPEVRRAVRRRIRR